MLAIALTALWIAWQYGTWFTQQAYWWVDVRPFLNADAQKAPLGPAFADCRHCPEMIVIPKGEFTMGGPLDSSGETDEYPRHIVKIASAFAIAKHETTLGEWNACASRGGCNGRVFAIGGRSEKLPVIQVNWQDAQSYARWLQQTTGKPYRLLSEAEWEYMARAGAEGDYSFGDDAEELAKYALFDAPAPQEVEKTQPNRFGVYDAMGNVSEWVQDCYQDAYRTVPRDGTAAVGGDCLRRVVRGGDWQSRDRALRLSSRSASPPASQTLYIGFRVARDLAP